MSANYKIIGDDGKQYGPVAAGQLRQWIAQGRAESRTPVLVEGAKEWTFVGLLPEFANCFSPAAPPPTIAPPFHPRKASGFATAGLICGILSWAPCCCCGGLPFNLFGLIFSLVGLLQISQRPEFYVGRVQAIAGLVLSILSLLLMAVLMATGNFHGSVNDWAF